MKQKRHYNQYFCSSSSSSRAIDHIMDKSLANSIRHDPAQYLLAGRTENNRHMHSYTQKNIALIAIFPSIIIISSSIIEQV